MSKLILRKAKSPILYPHSDLKVFIDNEYVFSLFDDHEVELNKGEYKVHVEYNSFVSSKSNLIAINMDQEEDQEIMVYGPFGKNGRWMILCFQIMGLIALVPIILGLGWGTTLVLIAIFLQVIMMINYSILGRKRVVLEKSKDNL